MLSIQFSLSTKDKLQLGTLAASARTKPQALMQLNRQKPSCTPSITQITGKQAMIVSNLGGESGEAPTLNPKPQTLSPTP